MSPVLPPPTPIKPMPGMISLEPDGGDPAGRVGYVSEVPQPLGSCSVTGFGEMVWNEDEQRYERTDGGILYTIQFFGNGTYTATVSIPPGPPCPETGIWKYAG